MRRFKTPNLEDFVIPQISKQETIQLTEIYKKHGKETLNKYLDAIIRRNEFNAKRH